MTNPQHDPDATPRPASPTRDAGGPLRLIVAVLGLALGIAFIALLVFGRYGG